MEVKPFIPYHEPKYKYTVTTNKLFGFDLPTNMDLFTRGNIISHVDDLIIIEFNKDGSKYIYEVIKNKNNNHVIIKENIYSDDVILEFNDYSSNGSVNDFTSKIKNMEYVFKGSEIIVKMETKKN